MKFIEFIEKKIGLKIKKDVLLKDYTTFKIGGPAKYFYEPSTLEELTKLINAANETKTNWFIIGNGSNILASDEGFNGLIIFFGEKFNNILINDEILTIQAGALLSDVAETALKNSLTGFEFASGIPGSIGGAVFMNAGAYGGEMKDIVCEVKGIVDEEEQIFNNKDMDFGYRKSLAHKNNMIITEVSIKLKHGEKNLIDEKMKELNSKRLEKQPLEFPSGGSTFKRPEGHYAAELIEKSGLKGYKIGGAEVSSKHSGFVINSGNATCEDVKNLISYIKKTVKNKFDVDLYTEIKLLGGEWN